MLKIFSHQKSSIFFVLTQDAVQIRRFFFLSATLHAQKKVKESLYFDLLPGPFTKRNFFFFIICKRNKNKRERQYNGNEVFICFYFYLLNTILK